MADGTCLDCGADVFRKGKVGFPPRRCTDCQKARRKAQNRQWYRDHPEWNADKGRRFREANPDYRPPCRDTAEYWQREYQRSAAWKRSHPDMAQGYTRAWRERNPERTKAANYERNRRRRARESGAETFLIIERDWRRLLARYRHRCAYCGADAPLTREHVIPLDRGGSHGIGNLLPVCGFCNSSKGRKLLVEWRARPTA